MPNAQKNGAIGYDLRTIEVAAIEVACRQGHRKAPVLIRRCLEQPVCGHHLCVLPCARTPQVVASQEAASIACAIALRYHESKSVCFGERWQERFAVESFRTMAELSPTITVNEMVVDLPGIADLELTPILESICAASRKLDRADLFSSLLKHSVEVVWKRYIDDISAEELGNRPGIMGRLLELAGRSGGDLEAMIATLDEHPLKMRVLYQFLRRPCEFVLKSALGRWREDVINLMVSEKQDLALKRFLDDTPIHLGEEPF